MIRSLTVAALLLSVAGIAAAQNPPIHYQQGGHLPPGTVGRQQLERGGPLRGYFQPVEIRAPLGCHVSVAIDGAFDEPQPAPRVVGMLIGAVYRVQITRIPNHPGREIYPTIELVNRLYPPPGQAIHFPVPIEVAAEDIELVFGERYITRVVYLEDPRRALPVAEGPHLSQRYFEILPTDDPLKVADELGRPMAFLRIGSRLPDAAGPNDQYLYGSPPVLLLPSATRRSAPLPFAPTPIIAPPPVGPPPGLPAAPGLLPQGSAPQPGAAGDAAQASFERLPTIGNAGAAAEVAPAFHQQRGDAQWPSSGSNPLRQRRPANP